MPLFSVIIPTYNRAVELDKALASLVIQEFKDFEVLVCDDGSTDNTQDIISCYKERLNLVYLSGSHSGGPAGPRNIGLKFARGEWICFLDSDDWWYKNKLSECAKNLDNKDFIYHDLEIYRDEYFNTKKILRSRQLKESAIADLLISHNPIANSSAVVRREILLLVGGFCEDKELIGVEDFDCWLKIAKKTSRFFYIHKSLGAYLIGQNISRNINHARREEILFERFVFGLEPREQVLALAALRYRQARIYHLNGLYYRAASVYWGSLRSSRLKGLAGLMFASIRLKI